MSGIESDSGTGANKFDTSPPGDSGGAPPQEDPPRTAYGLLRCSPEVVAGEEFELEVGLSQSPTPGVAGSKMRRPARSIGPYDLAIQVVTEGFELRSGESWRVDLRVTSRKAYPTRTLHLIAARQSEDLRQREIRATFSVSGELIGMAVRFLAVARSADFLSRDEAAPAASGVDLEMPTGPMPADLTVTIHLSPDRPFQLAWTFTTPYEGPQHGISVPVDPVVSDIGATPEAFARGLMVRVNAKEGKRGLYELLRGYGRAIATKMPAQFWELLGKVTAVAARRRRPPLLLVVSQEPYVPWELAVVEPPLDPAVPPYLAAQTNFGRWVLPDPKTSPELQRPRLPPPAEVSVASLAAVAGEYKLPAWPRLFEAEQEAQTLHDRYHAIQVDARSDPVLDCLRGDPAVDLLHFAMHGKSDSRGIENGLMLTDGVTLDPIQIMGVDLRRRPFVFLNACQVGQGDTLLGDSAGMASAFLFAGASGVIAPLWSIKDTVARELALDFYREILGPGTGNPTAAADISGARATDTSGAAAASAPGDASAGRLTGGAQRLAHASPAGFLRQARANFKDTPGPQSATWLAYQFFGHPALKLRLA